MNLERRKGGTIIATAHYSVEFSPPLAASDTLRLQKSREKINKSLNKVRYQENLSAEKQRKEGRKNLLCIMD